MNYGIMFSEELQKQGARAVPTVNVIKELVKRKNFDGVLTGFHETWGPGNGKKIPRYFPRKQSIDPLQYKKELLGESGGTDRAARLREYYENKKIPQDGFIGDNVVNLRPYSQSDRTIRDAQLALWNTKFGYSDVGNAATRLAKEQKKFFPWNRYPYAKQELDQAKSGLNAATSQLDDLINNRKWV